MSDAPKGPSHATGWSNSEGSGAITRVLVLFSVGSGWAPSARGRVNSTSTQAKSYTYDDNRLLQVTEGGATTSFQYDQNGSMTQKTVGSDVTTYSYAGGRRLTEVKLNGTSQASFSYDGNGARTAKTAGGVTTTYVNNTRDLTQTLQETESANTRSYVPGLLQFDPAQSGSAQWAHFHQDAQNNRVLSDGGASASKRWEYDPFGVLRTQSGTASSDFQYAGEQKDAETGLINLRARYYEPSLGRFISRDSVGGRPGFPQTFNRFAYALNNPIRHLDPSGYSTTVEGTGNPGQAAERDNPEYAFDSIKEKLEPGCSDCGYNEHALDECGSDCKEEDFRAATWNARKRWVEKLRDGEFSNGVGMGEWMNGVLGVLDYLGISVSLHDNIKALVANSGNLYSLQEGLNAHLGRRGGATPTSPSPELQEAIDKWKDFFDERLNNPTSNKLTSKFVTADNAGVTYGLERFKELAQTHGWNDGTTTAGQYNEFADFYWELFGPGTLAVKTIDSFISEQTGRPLTVTNRLGVQAGGMLMEAAAFAAYIDHKVRFPSWPVPGTR